MHCNEGVNSLKKKQSLSFDVYNGVDISGLYQYYEF